MNPSNNREHRPSGLSLGEAVLLTLLGALLYTAQVALAFLPNIELVTVLIIVYTRVFRLKSLISVYIFVALEGLTYGFGIWWFSYLYVWAVLVLITLLTGKEELPALFYACLACFFGLAFGSMTALSSLLLFGPGTALGYIIAGLGFDIVHAIGNFVTTLVLYTPLVKLLRQMLRGDNRPSR